MKRLLLHLLLVLALTMTTQVWGQSAVTLAQPSGSGTSTDPYLIGSPGELFWFAGLVNGTLNDGTQKNAQAHARLTADITLNEGTFSVSRAEVSSGDTKYYNHTLYYAGKAFNGFFESGTFDSSGVQESDKPQIEWKSLDKYSGTFDGDGHYISGLYQESSDQYAGFISQTASSVGFIVKNLELKNTCIINTSSSNQSCIGGICGYTGGVPFEISSCTFQGVIITEVGLSIGGIVGWISGYQRTTVADCQVKGDIIGYGSNDSQSSIGGIVGRVGTYGSIQNCCNEATIFDTATSNGMYVAGICGILSDSHTVSNCVNRGNITYTKTGYTNIGGISGGIFNSATIEYSYNTGTVSYTGPGTSESEINIGGVCGNLANGKIFYSFSTGGVEGGEATYKGSFSGQVANGTIANNCCVLKQSNLNAVGYDIPGNTTITVLENATDFSNGKAAYILGGDWGQTLKGTQVDAYPVVGGPKIYRNGSEGNYTYDNLQLITQSGTSYYQLNNALELRFFADRFNDSGNTLDTKDARLSTDIDLNPGFTFGTDGTYTGNATATTANPKPWTPIGTASNPYTGTFNGQRHLISGLYISGTTDAALFHTLGIDTNNGTKTGIVQNLGISTGNISTTASAGSICVDNAGTIENCYSLIPVTGGSSSSVGGLCATNTGTVQYSFTTQPTLCANIASGTVTNSYSLLASGSETGADTETDATSGPKSQTFFKGGYMTWLLNNSKTAVDAITWKQSTAQSNPDAYPTYYSGSSDNNLRVICIRLHRELTSEKGALIESYYLNPTNYTLPDLSGKEVVMGDATRPGYSLGWSDTSKGIYPHNVSSQLLDENLIIYESWIANHYKVVFHANYNEATQDNTEQSFVYSEAQALTENTFSRTGYTFSKWCTQENNNDGKGKLYDDKESVNELTTDSDGTFNLYALWTPNNYTVTFHANRPTTATDSNGDTKTQSFTYDEPQPLALNVFGSEARTFIGWSETASGEADSKYAQINSGEATVGATVSNLTATPNGNFDLYAVWRRLALTVIFDPNRDGDPNESGEEESMNNQSFISGTSQTLNKNLFTRQGYTFGGWKAIRNGVETTYTDQQQNVSLEATTEGEPLTFYAQWIPRQYTVKVISNKPLWGTVTIADAEGSEVGNELAADYRSTIYLFANARPGYQFLKWSDENTEASREYPVPLNGTTLTAYFTGETKTVTIQTGNSSKEVQVSKDGSELAEALTEPNSIAIIEPNSGITVPKGLSNVVVKSGSTMGTCTSLILTDKAAFSTPIKFTAEKVVYTRNLDGYTFANGTDGWSTLVVPFNGTLHADGKALAPFSSDSDTGGQYWLKRFTGNITDSKTLNFAYATTIEANQPYIIALPGDTWGTEHSLSGKTITVEATDVTISASPQPKESVGGDYSFTGTYDGLSSSVYYQLNAAGNTFEQQSGGGTVASFRCYLALFSNSLSVPKFFSIGNEDGTVTDISNISADTDGLRIYVRNGNILIESPTARSVSIYSIDGRLVRMVQLEGGVNTVSGLTRGFYIVERQKVVLK